MTDENIRVYEQVLQSEAWTQTRQLTIDGDVFRHLKHPAEVDEGVQHKLFVWICEATRPREHCPCGLYILQWLERKQATKG